MNSSTESLILSMPPEKNRHAAVQNLRQAKEDLRGNNKQPDSAQYTCLMFVGLLLIGMVLSLSAIFAFYINHLQAHAIQLEERIQALETSSCYQKQKRSAAAEVDDIEVKSRLTRHTEGDEEESREYRHHHAEHHGIPSHNIAMVYGDPKKIPTSSDEPDSKKSFKPTKRSGVECGAKRRLMKNGFEHYWCKTTDDKRVDSMQFSWRSQMYFYFQKASWMNWNESLENFNLTDNGSIEVRHEGIYIVHASIHFTDVTNREDPHYGVYKTDSPSGTEQLVSKCMVSQVEKEIRDYSGVYPCQAWQMLHLKAGEQVFMRIGGYSWFRIEKETFHLALIKLNDYSL